MKLAIKIAIGLASVASLGMVTGVILNPFNINNDVPPHLQHEMKVSWHFNGKPQDIPILEQGAFFDDSKYFDAIPTIKANPTDPHGTYFFDYEIEQFTSVEEHSGNFLYKVNSRDNSIYMSGYDVRRNPLFASLKTNPYLAKYNIDFLIRNSQNDWFLYLEHQTEGKICLQIPSGLNSTDVFSNATIKNLEVLNSAKANSNYTYTNNNLEPYTGNFIDDKGEEKTITFWFGKEQAQIPTSVPIMGLGVGIFKNSLEKKQQFLAVTEIDNTVLKLINLETITEWGTNTSGYRVIKMDFHLPTGKNKVNNMVMWLKNKQDEIAILREKRKQCPPNQAGTACRKEYEHQIKEVQKEIDEKAKELTKDMMLPMQ